MVPVDLQGKTIVVVGATGQVAETRRRGSAWNRPGSVVYPSNC
jgi:hypothetical protein